MYLALWRVLLAGLLPVLTVVFAKWGRPDFDNGEPPASQEKLTGRRRRADYAHRNHCEAFPFVAAAVSIAQQLHAPQATVNTLAALFIVARVAYTVPDLGDRPPLRSIMWAVAYACVIGLFITAAQTA